MRFLLISFLLTTPAMAAHSGIARPRTAPELSDVALAAMAAGGIFLVRRAMRARFSKMRRESPKD